MSKNKNSTIIMPFVNEGDNPFETIHSILQTTNPGTFNLIAIDDGSTIPYKENQFTSISKNFKFLRNETRQGVGYCRDMGAKLAETPYIIIIDAHMRFKPHWKDHLLYAVQREPKTLWCTTCLGLNQAQKDIEKSKSHYYGATINIINSNVTNDRPARQILEAKWSKPKDLSEYEIPCILGACYGMSRSWYMHLRGFEGLRMWGTSEPYISIKSWLSGGKCKIKKDIEVGHIFRDNAPYETHIWNLIYNKLFVLETIFPEEMRDKIESFLPKNKNYKRAREQINNDKDKILMLREYYRKIFVNDIEYYCKLFDIALPETTQGKVKFC